MGVTKTTLVEGNGQQYPKKGDVVSIHYTGCLLDASQPNKMGKQFDSSRGRGVFKTSIGTGRVIKGWDEGVPQMSVGEKAILEISPDYGYGNQGFPGLIPPQSTLVFEVELMGIN
ncbi:peptidyl-prolyl cis-trans isomerase [Aspergillus sclerotioniger CBS 115572]|uniref:peptidylprolyl isomerase n=1 Tax=Aspergillus sclerotioniger CBS 115572 TaxID=1450535 RepID=A0A317V189_9EURO|nr:peptidyl-prolyl cis-trans isomerase [Aspergillus sclerotioniger CBS 115572]PWY66848.1 peptidyl-prolyl cis-trans isomerase [Aspergillus sclerotioniger CBS 115572]